MQKIIGVVLAGLGLIPGVVLACSDGSPVIPDVPMAELTLSEILPNPERGEEFIELAIQRGGSYDGWKLADASGKTVAIADGIESNGFFLVWQSVSKLYLNNGGDTVSLIDPSGEVVDTVSYKTSVADESLAFIDGAWVAGEPTPGTANQATIVEEEPIEDAEPESDPTTDVDQAMDEEPEMTPSIQAIADIKKLEKGTDVIIEGMVISTFGEIGSRSAYIQDESGGIQLYVSSGNTPELAVGDQVTITGRTSTAYGEPRVLLDTVEVWDADLVEPKYIEELTEDVVGSLVVTMDTIGHKTSQQLDLESGITVYRKSSSEVSFADIEDGRAVQITGIVTQSNEKLRLIPRTQDDVVMEDESAGSPAIVEPANASGLDGSVSIQSVNTPPKNPAWKTWVGYAAGLILALIYLIHRNKHRFHPYLERLKRLDRKGKIS